MANRTALPALSKSEIEAVCQRDGYIVGAILEFSWGYDQTNIDFFKIVRRSGLTVWLVAIGKKNVVETGFMQGHCEPDPDKIVEYGSSDLNNPSAMPFRRVLRVWDGGVRGCRIRSYGWCDLWSGKPSHWTAYA
jgi:hypothetical protein